MNILYVTTSHSDYLANSLKEGMLSIKNYDVKIFETKDGEIVSQDLLNWADNIIYTTGINVPKIINPQEYANKIVIVDGSDWSHKTVELPHFLYFKRECIDNTTLPLSFCAKKNQYDCNIPFSNRDIDIFYSVHLLSNAIRKSVLEALMKLKDRYNIFCQGTTDGNNRLNSNEYMNILSRSKIGISVHGAGQDTIRYWEIPANGALLLTQKMTINIANDFIKTGSNKEAVEFLNIDDMVEKIHYYLQHQEEMEAIANRGKQKILQKHTSELRAKELLARINTKLTVVTSVWNRTDATIRWIKSLKNQTMYNDLELIIVDYGITEGLREKIEKLNDTKNIKYIPVSQKKQGVFNEALAKNIGIRASKTNKIVCTNIDIIYEKTFMEKIYNVMSSKKLVQAIRIDVPKECEKLDVVKDYDLIRNYPSHGQNAGCIGDCQAMMREDWFRLHGYDEDLDGYAVLDTDLQHRCKIDGFEIINIGCQETSHIHIAHEQNRSLLMEYANKNFAIAGQRGGIIVRNDDNWGIMRNRKLEIGTRGKGIDGFEHLDIVKREHIEYVCDASKELPFDDNTFEIIFASHILEHISHWKTLEVLKEWYRIIMINGSLEVWVPDIKVIVELYLKNQTDGWNPFSKSDPTATVTHWLATRLYYWDNDVNGFEWHKACFDEEYLTKLLYLAGFKKCERMERNETRGHDHGIINLGIRAIK